MLKRNCKHLEFGIRNRVCTKYVQFYEWNVAFYSPFIPFHLPLSLSISLCVYFLLSYYFFRVCVCCLLVRRIVFAQTEPHIPNWLCTIYYCCAYAWGVAAVTAMSTTAQHLVMCLCVMVNTVCTLCDDGRGRNEWMVYHCTVIGL